MALSKYLVGATFACASFASMAHAYHQGDFVVRAGVSGAHMSDSGEVRENNTPVINSSIDLRKDVVLGMNFTYFVRDNIGIELGLDNDYHIAMKGENYNVSNIGSFKVYLPTLTVDYFPKFSNVNWAKPYFGVGLSYARFTDERLTSSFTAYSGNPAGVPKMDGEYALVFKFGVDLPVRKHLMLNGSMVYHGLDSHWNVRHIPTHYAADFNLHTFQWLLGIGYKF